MKRLLTVLVAVSLVLTGCGQDQQPDPISGEFNVVPSESNINFTSIKNQDIGVTGFFEEVSGSVTVPDNGNVNETTGKITLSLTSLNTGLSVRDNRVIEHFFEVDTGTETADNDEAVFSISGLDSEKVKNISTLNKSRNLTAIGTMNIHGESVKQAMNLSVTRTAEDEVRVTTRKPYVFNIKKFNMVEPLQKLMEVCGHGDISLAVPLDINLTLRQS